MHFRLTLSTLIAFLLFTNLSQAQVDNLQAAASQIPITGVIVLENEEVRVNRGGNKWDFDVEFAESILDGINGDFISTPDLLPTNDVAISTSRKDSSSYAVWEFISRGTSACPSPGISSRLRIRSSITGETQDTLFIPVRTEVLRDYIEVHALQDVSIWRTPRALYSHVNGIPDRIRQHGGSFLKDQQYPTLFTSTDSEYELFSRSNGDYLLFQADGGLRNETGTPLGLGTIYAALDEPGERSKGGLLIAEDAVSRLWFNLRKDYAYDKNYNFHNVAALQGILTHLPTESPFFVGIFSDGTDPTKYYGVGRFNGDTVIIDRGADYDEFYPAYFSSFDCSKINGTEELRFAATLRLAEEPLDIVLASTSDDVTELINFGKTEISLDSVFLELRIQGQDTAYFVTPVVTNRSNSSIQELMLSGKYPEKDQDNWFRYGCIDFAEFGYTNINLAPGETRRLSAVELPAEKGNFTTSSIQFDISLDAADDRPIADGSLRFATATVEVTTSSSEDFATQRLELSPNPATNMLYINSSLELTQSATFTNMKGQVSTISLNGNTIDISEVPPGF